MNPFSPRRGLSASRWATRIGHERDMRGAGFSLGFIFLSACLGTTPPATTPAPASSPLVGVADASDTSACQIYVVDGIVVPPSAWAAMNPDDVASVVLLKGPNAIAAYGERARSGAIEITLVPPDARAQPCRPPTPATAAAASILVADLVRTERYTERGLRVDRHQSTWPMVRLFFKVLHGWKRNPFLSEAWHEGDTLIFNVTPEQDPRLPAGGRGLVYLRSSFNGGTRQARDTAITAVAGTGVPWFVSCHTVRRVEEAKSELQLLGEPQWRAP